MTSIISPWAYATQLATNAQTSLTNASNMLRSQRTPGPLDPTIMPPYVHNNAALRLAGGAVVEIDKALGLGQQLSTDVRTAFTSARDAARAGVQMLSDTTMMPVDRSRIPMQFDAAGMWLDLARNLIALEHPGVGGYEPHTPQHGGGLVPEGPDHGDGFVNPPVTTMPVPAPGDPGLPITIKPIDPIEIQLPSPDSPVQ